GNTTGSVQVQIHDNTTNEPNRNVVIALSNVVGATLGTQFDHEITIIDDDPALTVAFASARASVLATAGTISLTITLNQATTYPVAVDWATNPGTAVAGLHYTTSSGQATVSASSTSTSITIQVLHDQLYDIGRTFTVTLTSPSPVS